MNNTRLFISTLFILLFLSASGATAGIVTLDRTFNNSGYQLQTFGSDGGGGESVVVQADGKIVVGGWATNNISGPTDLGVMRFNSNGVLDTTFNGTGKVTTSMGPFETGRTLFIQPDGKIILTGERYSGNTNYDFALVRYLQNGALDNSFDGNGVAAPTINGFSEEFNYEAILQPDGKIVMVGTTAPATTVGQNLPTDIAVMRLNADGSLDTTFNSTGILVVRFNNVSESANAVVIQNDGKIIIGGFLNNFAKNDFLLMRFNSNGSFDTSFGSGGLVFTSINSSNNAISALALQTDGKILAGGSITGASAIVRYNSNGSVDTSFGSNGIVTTNQIINSLILKSDGKILSGGTINNSLSISRYNSNGTSDTTFNNTGTFSVSVPNNSCGGSAMYVQSDQKILISGTCYNNSSQINQMAVFRLQETTVQSPFDFDGDGKTDIGIFRPSTGAWWVDSSSTNATTATVFGASTDKLVPGDYTGDGKSDVAFWRPSTGEWFILRSGDGSFYSFQFGAAGDIPASGDFDADGKTDVAVFRPSSATWYALRSSDGGVTIQQFGAAEDQPVIADYDGDGKDDIAIFRPSTSAWWILKSSNNAVFAVQFGQTGDKTAPGDYTGDGKADIAFFRPSTGYWYILRSEDFSFYGFPFGTSADLPAPGDYDGDGKFDPAVFRPSSSVWYIQRSTSGFLAVQFGTTNDSPIPNAFVR